MALNIRTVMACAIPTAVAVFGFIFFWKRRKPEPDKKPEKMPLKNVAEECMCVEGSNLHVDHVVHDNNDTTLENTVPGEMFEELGAALSSEKSGVCDVSFTEDIEGAVEEEIVPCTSSQVMCSTLRVEDMPAGDLDLVCNVIDHDTSGFDWSESVAVASAAEKFSSEVDAGDCACPSTSDISSENTSCDQCVSNNSATGDGYQDMQDLDCEDNYSEDRSPCEDAMMKERDQAEEVDSLQSQVQRPESIPLSPSHPLPVESQSDQLNSSDSVSEASEVSNDSGKGASVSENNNLQINGDIKAVYQFAFPRDICGRLVGRYGKNINEIKDRSGAQITLLRQPYTKSTQICCLEGTESEIQMALDLIKKRFPSDRYPAISYDPIQTVPAIQSPVLSPDLMQLRLPVGVPSDVIVSSIVDVNNLFLQQPTHPTFPSLERLNQCMLTCYSQDLSVPPLPQPVEVGVICAVPIIEGWYRAQVLSPSGDGSECSVKFLDYGGYSQVQVGNMRQIRSDFMSLPFQATECYLANIAPLVDEEVFSVEAGALLEEMTQGHLLQAEVLSIDEGTGVPYINLYRVERDSVTFINRELMNQGLVRWTEMVQ